MKHLKYLCFFVIFTFPYTLFSFTLSGVEEKTIVISSQDKIMLNSCKNITIKFKKPLAGYIDLKNYFVIKNCENISIENWKMKSSKISNVRVKIKKIDEKNKILEVQPLDKKEELYFSQNIKNINRTKETYLALQSNNRISQRVAKLIYINDYKFRFKSFPFRSTKNIFILNFRYRTPVFNIINSKNISIRNISLNTAPGIVFLFRNSENIFLSEINITDVLRRKITTNADIFHCKDIAGKFILKDSFFEYVSDDIINIYTKALPIKCINGVCNFDKNLLLKSNKIYFYNISDATLEVAVVRKKLTQKLYLNKSLSTARNIQAYFDNKVDILIENNIFRNSRRHGVIIRNNGTTCINRNKFINLSGDAITFFNSPNAKEGLFSSNVVIKNNYINNCANSPLSNAAISIYAIKRDWKRVDNAKVFFHDIQIEKNDIKTRKHFYIRNCCKISINN